MARCWRPISSDLDHRRLQDHAVADPWLLRTPNVAVALFVSDHLQLAALTTIRLAWLLALGKLTVVGFLRSFWS